MRPWGQTELLLKKPSGLTAHRCQLERLRTKGQQPREGPGGPCWCIKAIFQPNPAGPTTGSNKYLGVSKLVSPAPTTLASHSLPAVGPPLCAQPQP